MEKQMNQNFQEARVAPKAGPEAQASAQQGFEMAGAARAAAVVRGGWSLAGLRQEDVIALGARIGNSALGALLGNEDGVTVTPFTYTPLQEKLEPFPIERISLALGLGSALPAEVDTVPFPAGLLGSGQGVSLTGWSGGGYDEPAS